MVTFFSRLTERPLWAQLKKKISCKPLNEFVSLGDGEYMNKS